MPPELRNIKKYMTVGKPMKLSSIWEVAGFSSSIYLEAWSRPKLGGPTQTSDTPLLK